MSSMIFSTITSLLGRTLPSRTLSATSIRCCRHARLRHPIEKLTNRQVISVNQAYKKRVDFSSDRMMFYYSDIHGGNFILTEDNQLFVIDFEDAGYLPESFMSHALYRRGNIFLRDIVAKTAVRKSENQAAMIFASYMFHIIWCGWPGKLV